MSRQYFNRSFVPSDRRFHQQTVESNRELNNNNHITVIGKKKNFLIKFHFQASASFTHHERKRSKPNDNEREQEYRSRHYQPYPYKLILKLFILIFIS
jgi:hypothetical protein